VGQLGEGIRLIHELRQLRAAEEGLDDGAHGARVDQIVERDPLGSLLMLIRSLINRAIARDQRRNWLAISSPTERTRRLPRWSMSSV